MFFGCREASNCPGDSSIKADAPHMKQRKTVQIKMYSHDIYIVDYTYRKPSPCVRDCRTSRPGNASSNHRASTGQTTVSVE